jgi:hypothetical protein
MTCSRIFVGLAFVGMYGQAADTPLAGQEPAARADGFVWSLPARRARDVRPELLPDLPAGMERLAPLTVTLSVRPEGGIARREAGVTRVVSRTADRVHIAEGRDREWLFVRNPLDPRRASGMLVEHRARAVVLHEESDLRNVLGLSGWASVISLGFDHAQLKATTRTNSVRTVGPLRFERIVPSSAATMPDGFWWSHDAALASGFLQPSPAGPVRVSVVAARAGADAAVLQDPLVRFSSYTVVDLAEWLEHP